MAPPAEVESQTPKMESPPQRPPMSPHPPRIIVIGAGSRGTSYARAIRDSTNGILVAVVEPISHKRLRLGKTYIWGANASPSAGQAFGDWRDFRDYEVQRRQREREREEEGRGGRGEEVEEGVDAVFICVQDEMHKEVILGLGGLGLHVMCEKPLATSLGDCLEIYRELLGVGKGEGKGDVVGRVPERIFSIGHVLRYSPHNMLLRKLVVEEMVLGEVLAVEHTEPVGWWHFAHSYVRGNWRNTAKAAPSLLTKSCHDIDFLLWLLCSPPPNSHLPPHLPFKISSSGSLQYFKQNRKPSIAGTATNCLSCAAEPTCLFSAKKIYLGAEPQTRGFGSGRNTDFPIHILVPEIEDLLKQDGIAAGEKAILNILEKDYNKEKMPKAERDKENWYGRCVFESDNDVCDNQVVIIDWKDSSLPLETPNNKESTRSGTLTLQATENSLERRRVKQAIFHMTSHTLKQCDRYTTISGTHGEIHADGTTITHHNFLTGESKIYHPHISEKGGHGGGDDGLARQFVGAVDAVKNGGVGVEEAQREWVGCDLEEVLRSHALVWAAEEARGRGVRVDWREWWDREVVGRFGGLGSRR